MSSEERSFEERAVKRVGCSGAAEGERRGERTETKKQKDEGEFNLLRISLVNLIEEWCACLFN